MFPKVEILEGRVDKDWAHTGGLSRSRCAKGDGSHCAPLDLLPSPVVQPSVRVWTIRPLAHACWPG